MSLLPATRSGELVPAEVVDTDYYPEDLEGDDPLAGLSPMERRFVLAYIGPARFNAAAAVREIGLGGRCGHERITGYRIKERPHVKAAIKTLLSHEGASVEECEVRMARRARTSLAHFYVIGPDGKPHFDIQAAYESGAMDAVRAFSFSRETMPTKYGTGTRDSISISLTDGQKADEILLKLHDRLTGGVNDDAMTDDEFARRMDDIVAAITEAVGDDVETLQKIRQKLAEL